MQDKNYRTLGGTLQNTLDGIKRAHEMGLWVEIVTLIIPGLMIQMKSYGMRRVLSRGFSWIFPGM